MSDSNHTCYIEHVCYLVGDTGGKTRLSLNHHNIKTIHELRDALRDLDLINGLKFKDRTGVEKDLAEHIKKKLAQMESFINYTQNRTQPISDGLVDITTTSKEQFDDFLTFGLGKVDYNEEMAVNSSRSRQLIPKGSPLDLWNKKVVMKDDLFPYFKRAEEWSLFCSRFELQAKVQDLSEVLNPNYVPSSHEEAQVFSGKNTFIYSVLEGHVTVPAGVTIIRSHGTTSDGQQTWIDLKNAFQDEIHGELRRQNLYKLITQQCIPPQNRKPYSHYLAEFQGWYREYNQLSSIPQQMNRAEFLENLKRYLKDVPEIRSCHNVIRVQKLTNPGAFTTTMEIGIYETYVTQLEEDDRMAETTSRLHSKKFNMNQTNASYYDVNNIDTYNPADYEVNLHDTSDYGVAFPSGETGYDVNASYNEGPGRVPNNGWEQLSGTDKAKWRSISGNGKESIVGAIVQAVEESLKIDNDDGDQKPPSRPLPSARKSTLGGVSSRNARANQSETEYAVNTADTTDNTNIRVNLVQALSRGTTDASTAYKTLPPAIADKVNDESSSDVAKAVKKAAPTDPRRLMSTHNTVEVPFKLLNPLTEPLDDSPPVTTKSKKLSKLKGRLKSFF